MLACRHVFSRRVTSSASAAVAAAAVAAANATSEPVHTQATPSAPSEGIPITELGNAMQEALKSLRPAALSIREVRDGDGETAVTGKWVSVHYTTRLVGDGSVIEDTRTSGYGDRDYGKPCQFELGDLGDSAVLRALHVGALDMRVGGVRRVRTSLLDKTFGYHEPPLALEPRGSDGRPVQRRMQGDWLIDIEITLEAVAAERPPGPLQRALASVRMLFRS